MPQGQRDQARIRAFGIPERTGGIAGEPHRISDQFGDEQFRRFGRALTDPPAGIQETRVYRRAQNGEVGSVTRANAPASIGLGWPGRGGSQADPIAGQVFALAPLTRATCTVIVNVTSVHASCACRCPSGPVSLPVSWTARPRKGPSWTFTGSPQTRHRNTLHPITSGSLIADCPTWRGQVKGLAAT